MKIHLSRGKRLDMSEEAEGGSDETANDVVRLFPKEKKRSKKWRRWMVCLLGFVAVSLLTAMCVMCTFVVILGRFEFDFFSWFKVQNQTDVPSAAPITSNDDYLVTNRLANYSSKSLTQAVNLVRSLHDNPLQCQAVPTVSRFDCFPGAYANEEKCHARGCCWVPPPQEASGGDSDEDEDSWRLIKHDIPYCFFPAAYNSHKVVKVKPSEFGVSVWYQRLLDSGYPNDLDKFRMDIVLKNNNMIQVKIYQDKRSTFSNPYIPSGDHLGSQPLLFNDIHIDVSEDGFGFRIKQRSSGRILFDTIDAGGFVFSEQMLQISTFLPSHFVYGLGERTAPLLRDTDYTSYIMWNNDMVQEYESPNVYGSHPFLMALDGSGNAQGISFLNSHAMEVALQPTPAVTFRALGGYFNLNIMVGPSPIEVVEQYTQLIGKPFLVPFWSLGYQQCRWGWSSVKETMAVLERNLKIGIPIDVQWNDIDYMDQKKDFTYDNASFEGLPEFLNLLHENHMHYVPIIDPGVTNNQPAGTYPPYDMGLEMDIFIRNSSDQPFVGDVWVPDSVWPDFTHPRALEYWHKNLKDFHQKVPIDGVWIDMNEPSNFQDGEKNRGCTKLGSDGFELDNPPFLPAGIRGNSLYAKTLCPSARQYYGFHYEYHNVYGLAETIATATAMRQIRKKRAFVVSRSTFPGQGHYGAHWTGDISSSWDDLKYSIPAIINMNMYGIPMVGADICGFNGDTTEQLCSRWMQLGAFYPFSRNHNTIGKRDQDPAAMGPLVIASSQNALGIRYKLLSFFYTHMVRAHLNGTPAVRSLLMNYPTDRTTYGIDKQFMWGDQLMVVPVLQPNTEQVTGYFPKGTWYLYHNEMEPIQGPKFAEVEAPLTQIPLFVKGGSIIPLKRNGSTTYESALNPFFLRLYLPKEECISSGDIDSANRNSSSCSVTAVGELMVDDGDSLDSMESGNFTHVNFESSHDFNANTGKMFSKVASDGYKQTPLLTFVSLHGIGKPVNEVRLAGQTVHHFQDTDIDMIGIPHLTIDLNQPFMLEWL